MECHDIEIEVRPDGTIQAHVKGAKGPACMEYVKLLEQIMGAPAEVEHTSEYYEPPTQVEIRLDQRTGR